MNDISIFVPAPGKPLTPFIAGRSAIVGCEPQDGRISVYYEGNIYGYPGMTRFADRVAAAAGRLAEHYPTVARASLPTSDLARIGYWDDEAGVVVLDEPGAQATLAAYLETDALDPDELVGISSSRWQIRRDLETAKVSPDPAVRFAAAWYERHQARR
jgi:hypothetical protein